VDEGAAREIVRAVGDRAEVVAVFVNEPSVAVTSLCARLGISRVQLHGEETPEDAARLSLWRLKAILAGGEVDLQALRTYPCEAFLLDAGAGSAYGGTGRELPWKTLRARFGDLLAKPGKPGPGRPWVLAGGLTPDNVERAIAEARPDAVDVASGVETEPGRKDPEKVAAFVERARKGFLVAGR
jgi:phosphoribosylanthranilate isomerase